MSPTTPSVIKDSLPFNRRRLRLDGFDPSVTTSVQEDFEKKQRLLETLDTALELGGAGYNVFGSFLTIELSIGFYVTFMYISSNFTSNHVFLPSFSVLF